MDPQQISVLVPVANGGVGFLRVLDAIRAAQPPAGELIVIDDGSTDGSAEAARARGATVLKTAQPHSGPAVARNLGAAQAHGAILFFVDADVVIPPEAVGRVAEAFGDPAVSALFGSYDTSPADPSPISQYKNLMHHYVHQRSRRAATSFWAGCGAVRRDVFLQMGGFAASFARPSIEDIELGARLTRAGYHIVLLHELQVKHLKKWTLQSLLKTDILDRAIPWAQLIVREREMPQDLNLQTSHRISAVLCYVLVAALMAALLTPWAWAAVAAVVSALLALNWDLYRFFWRMRGPGLVLVAIPLHWLYYLYSTASLAGVIAVSVLRPAPVPAPERNE